MREGERESVVQDAAADPGYSSPSSSAFSRDLLIIPRVRIRRLQEEDKEEVEEEEVEEEEEVRGPYPLAGLVYYNRA